MEIKMHQLNKKCPEISKYPPRSYRFSKELHDGYEVYRCPIHGPISLANGQILSIKKGLVKPSTKGAKK